MRRGGGWSSANKSTQQATLKTLITSMYSTVHHTLHSTMKYTVYSTVYSLVWCRVVCRLQFLGQREGGCSIENKSSQQATLNTVNTSMYITVHSTMNFTFYSTVYIVVSCRVMSRVQYLGGKEGGCSSEKKFNSVRYLKNLKHFNVH